MEGTINKELVRKHFDRHAHEYDRYAVVQAEMAAELMALVRRETADARVRAVLEIGCGTGLLTQQLVRAFPSAQLTAIDVAPAMIARTRNKLGAAADAVRFVAGDAEAGVPEGGFDLIVSNATFQWFAAPGATLRAYADSLYPGGVLAFATFGPDTFCELHASFRAAERELDAPHTPHGQPFHAGAQLSAMLAGADGRFHWRAARRTLAYPRVRDFLDSVKRVGAGNAYGGAQAAEGRAVSGRRLFAAMERHYASCYADEGEGGIRATYDLIYGVYHRNGADAVE